MNRLTSFILMSFFFVNTLNAITPMKSKAVTSDSDDKYTCLYSFTCKGKDYQLVGMNLQGLSDKQTALSTCIHGTGGHLKPAQVVESASTCDSPQTILKPKARVGWIWGAATVGIPYRVESSESCWKGGSCRKH